MADIVRMYSGSARVLAVYHGAVQIWSEAQSAPRPAPIAEASISPSILAVGDVLTRVRAIWEEGVTVTGEGWYLLSGTQWVPTGETGETFTVPAGQQRAAWRETGTDEEGYVYTATSNIAEIVTLPTVVTPATLTGTPQPGQSYTSTAATFAGYPTPEVSHFVQRQLGTTGAIETVALTGTFVAGYRYRPATRVRLPALQFEAWDYGDGWTDIVAVPAVAPTVILSRTPAGAITEGDTVTLTATATGTPVPTPVWTITRNGQPFTTAGGTWERSIDDIEDGDYVVTVTVTNSAGSASDTVSFAAAAASTDVPPYVITNPALPALTAGVPVTASAATFGGTPTPTATHKIQRRLPPSGTPEDVVTGLNFTPAANYQYRRASSASNGVGSPAVAESPWSDTVPQVDWAFSESDGVLTIPVHPGQPNTPSVTDITPTSARIVPGTAPTPAVTRMLMIPKADFNEAQPELTAFGNALSFAGNSTSDQLPGTPYIIWRESAPVEFDTLAAVEFVDTFSTNLGSDLAGHVSESSHTWAAPLSSIGMRITTGGRVRGFSNNATSNMQLNGYELPSAGGYVEAKAYAMGTNQEGQASVRRAGTLGYIAFGIDADNFLQLAFVAPSAGAANDTIQVQERIGGTSFTRITHSVPGMSDIMAEHTARLYINRTTKALRLLVEGVEVATGSYAGTYPAGTKTGVRWGGSASQAPSDYSAMQFNELSAGGL
ncbi:MULTISPECIES: hypothetical protein [unclassified Haematobacter]|uniref:hypothetical protein n=1 Tax=unclassified Haematobacter TaxID=2640585 RepID=UPI0025B7AEBA|nr:MULTISPECIES: hypothetical protein [unclassified Haematobacter]